MYVTFLCYLPFHKLTIFFCCYLHNMESIFENIQSVFQMSQKILAEYRMIDKLLQGNFLRMVVLLLDTFLMDVKGTLFLQENFFSIYSRTIHNLKKKRFLCHPKYFGVSKLEVRNVWPLTCTFTYIIRVRGAFDFLHETLRTEMIYFIARFTSITLSSPDYQIDLQIMFSLLLYRQLFTYPDICLV